MLDGKRQAKCLVLPCDIYSAIGTFIGESVVHIIIISFQLHVFINRSWKNHLRSCKTDNQAIIYQSLCILIDEPDVAKFNTTMDLFINHWKFTEPEFIQYFSQFYQNRPGILHKYIYML